MPTIVLSSALKHHFSLEKMNERETYPNLRFQEFNDVWKEGRLENFFSEFRSGKGITSSDINDKGHYPVYGGNGLRGYTDKFTHEGNYFLIGRQGALCGNINRVNGKVFISEHAIACKANESSDTEFLSQRLDFANLNRLSESSAQPGLAVNKLLRLKFFMPCLSEQIKIASYLTVIDEKIRLLSLKKSLLARYKKGVMQKIFSQEIRFKKDDGNNYPNWQEKKLKEVLFEHKTKSSGNEQVFSVSVHKALINQIEHLGRSFAAKNTDHYNLVKPNDIVYTKSPTGNFPFGIIKQSRVKKNVIVSPLYGVFTPETNHLGYLLDTYFESTINVYNYLHPIIQKGAKNTINITNNTFLSKSLRLPVNQDEQMKIGSFLKIIDKKIELTTIELEKTKTFKKGLLQQMFV